MINKLDLSADSSTIVDALEKYAEEYRKNLYLPQFLRARQIVINHVVKYVSRGKRILDINCGTAIDAIKLAELGYEVTGVDISSAMISIAREEISKAKVSSLVKLETADYRAMPKFEHKFDAVLSNFGGINFAKDLNPIFKSVSDSLNQGGIFMVNTVNRICAAEIAIFMLKGRISKASRRITGGKARIGGKLVELYYHPKRSFVNDGNRLGFKLIDSFGLNIFAPPLWASDFFKFHGKVAGFLEQIDDAIRRIPLIRSLGDFMVLVFRKIE
ncbi:MAG: class I SAM-dependent methyltransferase [Candidatus Kryptoniota bacterium]